MPSKGCYTDSLWLRLMGRYLPLPVASILYVYYPPVLEYASHVWHGSLREEDAMSLERIQGSVARSLLQPDWVTPKEELFRLLGWPALRWRREITSLTMFHNLLRSHPEPLSECLFQYASATAAAASPSNFCSHTHAPHATLNHFFIDRLFYGTHSRTAYNHSEIVNHFEMLSRTTTNHISLPQQKTFPYHSPLPSDSM